MISKWNDFLRSINEEVEESTIYTRKGDPFEYKVVSDNWHAKRKGTKKWYNISGEDYIEKYQKSICILDKEFPEARTSGAPKRKECQKSGEKTQEKTAGVAPEKTAQVATETPTPTVTETPTATPSEKPGKQPQKVEESRMFTSNDPKSVDNTILEMVKSGDIYLDYRDDRNSKYVKKVDIIVKSKLPISDSDSRNLELYFKGAGLEAGAPSLKNQKDNQIKRGDKIHHYKFIPESNECAEDVPLKEDNHLSYFLHFYYADQLKKRGLFGLGRGFKLKGVEVSPETLKKVEEFAGALIYKPAVKYVEKEKPDNQTNQPGQQQEKKEDKNSSVGTLEDTSTDQATAQRKAMHKYNKLSGIDGRTKKIIDQKAYQLPDGKYKYEIKYELTKESKKIHIPSNFGQNIISQVRSQNRNVIRNQQNIDTIYNELKKAAGGTGTNERDLQNAIDKLTSIADYNALNTKISQNPIDGSNNLQEILNGELGISDARTAAYIKRKLQKIGIDMTYGANNTDVFTNSIKLNTTSQSGGQAGGGQAGGGQAGSRSTICNKALGANEGPKIDEFTLTFPGDTVYKYVSKNGKWFVLNIRTQKRFGLTDLINGGCTKYQVSVDRLNKQFPNTSQKQDQTNTNQTTTSGTTSDVRNQGEITTIPSRDTRSVSSGNETLDQQIKPGKPVVIKPSQVELTKESKKIHSFKQFTNHI